MDTRTLQIIIYVLIGLTVAISIALIIFSAKSQRAIEILKGKIEGYEKDIEQKDITLAEQSSLIESQEKSYKFLSNNNNELISEIEKTKIVADNIKEQNRELNRQIVSLKSQISSLEEELNQAAEAEVKTAVEEKKETKLTEMKREELLALAKEKGITGVSKKSKSDLIELLSSK